MRKHSIKLLVYLAALAVVGGSIFVYTSPAWPKVAHAAEQQLMTLDPTGLPATLVSQSTYSGQDVQTNWSLSNGDSVTIAGPKGSVLDILPASGTLGSGIAMGAETFAVTPPLTSNSAITGNQAIEQFAASGLSLYHDALAVGFSSAEALQMVDEAPANRTIGYICAAWKWKGYAWTHECATQVLLQSNGSTNWYIAIKDKTSMEAVGHSALVSYATWVTHAGHDLIDWNPDGTINSGNCHDITLSVGYNGTGISFVVNVCPQTLSPKFTNYDGFGATWTNTNGVCTNTWERDPSASVEYDAGGARTNNYSLWGGPPTDYLNAC